MPTIIIDNSDDNDEYLSCSEANEDVPDEDVPDEDVPNEDVPNEDVPGKHQIPIFTSNLPIFLQL
jgi:hypothetical protein